MEDKVLNYLVGHITDGNRIYGYKIEEQHVVFESDLNKLQNVMFLIERFRNYINSQKNQNEGQEQVTQLTGIPNNAPIKLFEHIEELLQE